MAGGSTDAVLLKHLQTLYQAGAIGGLTDGQLLERFMAGREGAAEAAFAALAERHGPMVLRVCRQMLGDPHEAQDAFQATFLVLVRKADSVRKRDSIASWLYGVARRVAIRSRADSARRRRLERRGATRAAVESPGEGAPDESWPELHEEIARLPERYREPLVLCHLEGLTTEAAAQRLGCPQGTILSRLSRARERLRARLTRRGLALPAGLLAAGLSPDAATAALPAPLLDATVRASLDFAERQATTAVLASTRAAALARGVLSAMTISKLKVLGAAALACAIALGGMQTFARQFGGLSGHKVTAKPDDGDRQAALLRSVDKLQAELDEATRRNAVLQKELQDLRANLEALRTGQPAAATKDADEGGGRGRATTTPSAGAARSRASLGRGVSGGGPDQPQYFRLGKIIFVVSPVGDKVSVYDTTTSKAKSIRLPASKEAPLRMVPVMGPGPGPLAPIIEGPKITRVAAYDIQDGNWYPQDLREPVEGRASPIVGPGVVVYGLGRFVYAFSGEARRWDVAELPEGVSSRPVVGPGFASVEGDGHAFTFSGKTGKWDHVDIRALIDAAEEGESDNAKPKK